MKILLFSFCGTMWLLLLLSSFVSSGP
jgi:hypothetical protein